MFDKHLLIGISLVLIWTCLDLKRSYLNPLPKKSTSKLSSDDIPIPKIKTQKISTIKIRYCQSCGYRNTFEQFSELVRTNYPNMITIGENHPPSLFKGLLAKAFSFIKMGLLICLLFGQNPFPYLSIPTPRIFLWALQKKMYACLMIFFFSNSIESYLTSTGAFEIFIDNIPLWSKFDTGRMPTTNEFIQMLQPFTINSGDSL